MEQHGGVIQTQMMHILHWRKTGAGDQFALHGRLAHLGSGTELFNGQILGVVTADIIEQIAQLFEQMGLLGYAADTTPLLHIAAMVNQQCINQALQRMQISFLSLCCLIQNLCREVI